MNIHHEVADGQARSNSTFAGVAPSSSGVPAAFAGISRGEIFGETVYDGAAGSAGFLCEAYDFMKSRGRLTTKDLTARQTRTF